ncbi:phage tail protein [Leptolyngbya sp. AN03gr2]|uniref:phage tail protein n=1 Tax=unclassified Leptolyngbya TaxID=2650499 RepID=UPI003D32311D
MVNQINNAGVTAIKSILGIPHDPYSACNFWVEVGGLVVGGFSSVKGLESSITMKSYEEGGVNNFVHQFPETTSYSNIVLSRGLTDNDLLWRWYWAATQGMIVQHSGTILLLDRQQRPVQWWNFLNAYPVKWTGPAFDASSDEIAIEEFELVHQGIQKFPAAPLSQAILSS